MAMSKIINGEIFYPPLAIVKKLNISPTALYKWEKTGLIKLHGGGVRRYNKRDLFTAYICMEASNARIFDKKTGGSLAKKAEAFFTQYCIEQHTDAHALYQWTPKGWTVSEEEMYLEPINKIVNFKSALKKFSKLCEELYGN